MPTMAPARGHIDMGARRAVRVTLSSGRFPPTRGGRVMAFSIRLPLIVRIALLACAIAALIGGAHLWGIERGRSEWRLAAAQRGADLRVYRDTSSALLTELVVKELSLREPGLTEWEVVNRLRDWSHANTTVATENALLDKDTRFGFFNRSAGEIFAAFFQDRGGVWCGGSAYALMELYRLFGFQASSLDYGRSGVMTHVVTLVKIRHGGTEKTVVQDPTFNLGYVAEDGTPFDYLDLLKVLVRHQHHRVHIVMGNRGGGNALVHPRDAAFPFDHVIDADTPPAVLANGVKKYRSRLSLERFERQFGEPIRRFLRNEGHPGHMLYLHLYPLAGSDRDLVEAAKRLTGRA